MESKELMIGNWVKRPRSLDDRVIVPSIVDKVSGIGTFGNIEFHRDPTVIGFDCPAKHLAGIELTPEILEMAGWANYKSYYKYGTVKIWVTGDDEFTTVFSYDHAGVHIKYLHQLQNLFFSLTSTHLKIELK